MGRADSDTASQAQGGVTREGAGLAQAGRGRKGGGVGRLKTGWGRAAAAALGQDDGGGGAGRRAAAGWVWCARGEGGSRVGHSAEQSHARVKPQERSFYVPNLFSF
jgi:hypothetical protein